MLIYGLRILYAVMLVAVMIRLLPAVVRAFRREPRALDFVWALFCGLAFDRMIFVARSWAFNDPPRSGWEAGTLVFGYVVAVALKAGVLLAHHWYSSDDA